MDRLHAWTDGRMTRIFYSKHLYVCLGEEKCRELLVLFFPFSQADRTLIIIKLRIKVRSARPEAGEG